MAAQTSRLSRVLVVAYYFPPMGLSGVQRVAKLVKYLPEHGWQPTVLTVTPRGYFAYDDDLLDEMAAAGVEVRRTTSLDPSYIFGRKRLVALPPEERRRRWAWLNQLAFVPDSKIGWYPFALRAGKRLLRARPFDAILASAPPYTGHLVAARLGAASGLPVVLDFRDDWVANPRHHYPTVLHERLNRWLERYAVSHAARVLTINEHIRRSLLERNDDHLAEDHIVVVPQGFDPADFDVEPFARKDDRVRFVYSGIFYDAQSPDYFLRALAQAIERAPALRDRIEAVFVGLVPERSMRLAEELGLGDVIRVEGYLSHEEAVRHLVTADVLWMTIGRQPGAEGISTSKLFEYFGARKPILALVPEGTAADALRGYGAATIVPPDDVPAIAGAIARLVESSHAASHVQPDGDFIARFDRRRLAGDVARLLDVCSEER